MLISRSDALLNLGNQIDLGEGGLFFLGYGILHIFFKTSLIDQFKTSLKTID